MKFYNDKSKQDYNRWVEKNSHYSKSVQIVDFSKRWVELLEEHLDTMPTTWKQDYDQTNLNVKGLDGFQKGAASAAIIRWWKYGERLYKLDPEFFGEGWKDYFRKR